MSSNDNGISRRDILRPWKQRASPAAQEEFKRRDFFVTDEEEETSTPAAQEGADETGGPSRRDFVKTVGAAAATVAVVQAPAVEAAVSMRQQVVAAIGDLLIPSDPGDPGYKDLERFKITEEVMKALPGVSEAEATLWNDTAKAKFGGKTFLALEAPQREQYVTQILDGTVSNDPKILERLRRVFRNTRRRIVTLYYANFPEHQWPRDKNGLPILRPGDEHQITNPNTKDLITGWDQSGFHGPLTWEVEEHRRNLMKAIHWHEGWSPFDYQPEPVALRGRKLS